MSDRLPIAFRICSDTRNWRKSWRELWLLCNQARCEVLQVYLKGDLDQGSLAWRKLMSQTFRTAQKPTAGDTQAWIHLEGAPSQLQQGFIFYDAALSDLARLFSSKICSATERSKHTWHLWGSKEVDLSGPLGPITYWIADTIDGGLFSLIFWPRVYTL